MSKGTGRWRRLLPTRADRSLTLQHTLEPINADLELEAANTNADWSLTPPGEEGYYNRREQTGASHSSTPSNRLKQTPSSSSHHRPGTDHLQCQGATNVVDGCEYGRGPEPHTSFTLPGGIGNDPGGFADTTRPSKDQSLNPLNALPRQPSGYFFELSLDASDGNWVSKEAVAHESRPKPHTPERERLRLQASSFKATSTCWL
ncbi:unnamed protein product [Cyclocybe aegerita]|uniref:Uncharacterized protein n=1 Tax=Cyclocybe aegerita TaxID=1973307 RepID=A0A8S0XIA3_CYCAE|nr:unnamed protein product [Cyclocybe aegerita]